LWSPALELFATRGMRRDDRFRDAAADAYSGAAILSNAQGTLTIILALILGATVWAEPALESTTILVSATVAAAGHRRADPARPEQAVGSIRAAPC
jgi:hypothetical protein